MGEKGRNTREDLKNTRKKSQQKNSKNPKFLSGVLERQITVKVSEDDKPEADERFYVILYDADGDASPYHRPTATITILANDDAGGVFRCELTLMMTMTLHRMIDPRLPLLS